MLFRFRFLLLLHHKNDIDFDGRRKSECEREREKEIQIQKKEQKKATPQLFHYSTKGLVIFLFLMKQSRTMCAEIDFDKVKEDTLHTETHENK